VVSDKYEFRSAGEYMVAMEFIRTTIDLLRTPQAIGEAAETVLTKDNFTEEQKRYAKDFFEQIGKLTQKELDQLMADYKTASKAPQE